MADGFQRSSSTPSVHFARNFAMAALQMGFGAGIKAIEAGKRRKAEGIL
jgi:hypothetical protein